MSIRRRWIGAAATLVFLMATPLAMWTWLRTSLPDYDGTVPVAGLGAEALIARDQRAVPHIWAASVEDALFALGYAHAQDRLFMLEYYRHLSQGRLAELIGPAGVESDILVRLMNIEITPESVLLRQDPHTIARFSAYVAGINAFLDQRTGALPPEFVYLRATPTRWTVADALMIDNLTDLARSGWSSKIEHLRLRQRLPEDVVNAVQSDFSELDVSLLRPLPELNSKALPVASQAPPAMPPAFSRASNAWAVSAERSSSGAVLFAADPHLEFTLPSIFTPVRISTPTWHFAGFVIPGIAWFVGHNGRQHWGMTHAAEDMTDVYIEESDPSGTRYRTANGWKPFDVHDQRIAVRGAPDVPIRFRLTERGPVISDHLEQARVARSTLPDHQILVLAGVNSLLEPRGGRQYGLNHELMLASSLAEADSILARQLDVDNLTYADDSGNIAIRTLALGPHRESGDGQRPRMAWLARTGDGTTFREPSLRPQATNPPSGCVFNANQPVESGDAHCGPKSVNALRPERLRARLAEVQLHSLESFRSIQLDVVSPVALEMLPALHGLNLSGPLESQALSIVESWDGETGIDSVAATIFHVWLREFGAAIVGSLSASWSVELPHPSMRRYTQMLQQGSDWCRAVQPGVDDPRAACRALAEIAFQRSVAKLSDAAGGDLASWQWGQFHQAVFEHPVFSRVLWLRGFGERRVPIPGGPETVNVAGSSWQVGVEFPVYHGALTRRLEEVGGRPEQNRVAFAAGVSGNPFSPYYDDQIGPWSRGEYFSLEHDIDEVAREGLGTLRLVPK